VYRANFDTHYLLTRTVTPARFGEIEATPPSPDGYYKAGTPVRLFAAANNRRVFAGWSGALSGAVNPVAIVMDAPKSVTAAYNLTVTISTSPNNRDFLVDGVRYTDTHTFTWTPESGHQLDLPRSGFFSTNQPGGPGTRHVFKRWSDGGEPAHAITASPGNEVIVAEFTTQHQLTTSVIPPGGGRITVSPSSSDGYYDAGTEVVLSAVDAASSPFSSWGGDLAGTAVSQSIRLDGPRRVTAAFGVPPPPVSGIVSPPPNSVLTGSTATFAWFSVAGAENYLLSIGTTQGEVNVFSGLTRDVRQTVNNLPCNGGTLWVRLATRIGGVWQEPRDYQYVAAPSCSTAP
jgi:hypothetical protein